ncbi:hypothetical protein J4Q44_G00083590 [Coregonus suidteri]|uniref:Integrin beta n=1 Tax=Coregonus suidteri TaxID=861788 RepID=A0AAN8M0R8_9TELE
MVGVFLLGTFLLYCVGQNQIQGVPQVCVSQPSCSACLRSPGCAWWCKHKDFLKSGESTERRCDTVESLRTRRCEQTDIINPQSELVFLKNNELSSNPDNVVQLKPQNLLFKLRVDQLLETIKKDWAGHIWARTSLSTLKNVTKKVRIGFGSFVDKGGSAAAVCQGVIGWNNVTRILVYTSDDTFHIAGDGRLAGIFEPHDGKCHLNGSGFYEGTKYDYPSVGQLTRVLADNNIQLIFAVTEDQCLLPTRSGMTGEISVLGVLKNDSSNVVQLISEAYNNLSSTMLLEHHGAPSGLDVTYRSHCTPGEGDNTPWQRRGDVHEHQAQPAG